MNGQGVVIVGLAVLCLGGTLPERKQEAVYYVAPDGNDAWSGRLAQPDAARSDGPFATIPRARDAIREMKRRLGRLPEAVTVQVRAGTYFLDQPIRFGPEDSGSASVPIRYTAYPNERPVLSGGRPITAWTSADGRRWTAFVPEVKAGRLTFNRLRVGDRVEVRARVPNADPSDPIKGGWLFALPPPSSRGGAGVSVACIHNPGDWLQYTIEVPADGEYRYWVYGAMLNKPHTSDDISGCTAISIDDGPPVPLMNMKDTGGWTNFRWIQAATVRLTRGRHKLVWKNLKGGGLNFDSFVLTDDPSWTPSGPAAPPAAQGCHRLLVEAEAFEQSHGPDLKIEAYQYKHPTDIHCRPDVLAAWPLSPEPEVHIFARWGWYNRIVPIRRVDPVQGLIQLPEGWGEEVWSANRFFIENVYEALDAPGEWYLDRRTGQVTYLARDADFPTKTPAVAAVLDRLIELQGDPRAGPVEHVTLSGFFFTDVSASGRVRTAYDQDDATVHLVHARHCRIESCAFRHVAGHAVRVGPGCADNAIVGNSMAWTGQGGVRIDGSRDENAHQGRPREERPCRTLVQGNHIHHIGQLYKHVAGVYVNFGMANTIVHNLIHDVPRYGISLKFDSAGNVVAFNEVRRTNLETNDTGGIELYLNMGGNRIEHNLVVDTVGLKCERPGEFKTPYFSWGIYLDGYSSHVQVRHNIVLRAYLGGITLGGRGNVVENNIFAAGQTSQVWFYPFHEAHNKPGPPNRFQRNIIYYTEPEALAIRLYGLQRPTRRYVESDYNLFWAAGQAPVINLGQSKPAESWRHWQTQEEQDVHSLVADPQFVNPARDDYTLRADSPARKLGIEPVATDRIGLRGTPPPRAPADD